MIEIAMYTCVNKLFWVLDYCTILSTYIGNKSLSSISLRHSYVQYVYNCLTEEIRNGTVFKFMAISYQKTFF